VNASYSFTPFTHKEDTSVLPAFDDPFYQTAKYESFLLTVSRILHDNQVQRSAFIRTVGMWKGQHEPSVSVEVYGNKRDIEIAGRIIQEHFNQDAVRITYENGVHTHQQYVFRQPVYMPSVVIERLVSVGISGAQLTPSSIRIDIPGELDEDTVQKLSEWFGKPNQIPCEIVRIKRA
jgi:hypothetical protein